MKTSSKNENTVLVTLLNDHIVDERSRNEEILKVVESLRDNHFAHLKSDLETFALDVSALKVEIN